MHQTAENFPFFLGKRAWLWGKMATPFFFLNSKCFLNIAKKMFEFLTFSTIFALKVVLFSQRSFAVAVVVVEQKQKNCPVYQCWIDTFFSSSFDSLSF